MSDKNKYTPSRRKTLLTTAGLGSALIGATGMASAKGGSGKGNKGNGNGSGKNKNQGYYYDKDGDLVIPDSELAKWEVVVVEDENKAKLDSDVLPQSAEGVDIYVGENKNAVPPSEQVTTSSLPPTYITLASGTLPSDFPELGGMGWKLTGGVRFNLIRLEVTADLTFSIGGVGVELWGVGIGYSSRRGYCADVSPGAFPLVIEPCLDLQFGAEEVTLGGSINLCSPEVGGFSYCLGALSYSQSVDVPQEVQDALP